MTSAPAQPPATRAAAPARGDGPRERAHLLPPPRWTGSTAGAILHGAGGAAVAACLAVESPFAYDVGISEGPFALVSPDMAVAAHVWAAAFAVPALAVLAGRGRPGTRWALALLAAVWGTFAVSVLALAVRDAFAECAPGVAYAVLCAGAWRTAAALARRAP